jgi:hemerythrin superfamily protein
MSSDIYNRLSYYSQQGRGILSNLHQAQSRPNTIGAEMVKDLVRIGKEKISNGLGEFAGDFFESGRAKRYGRKYTKLYLNQQEMQAPPAVMPQFDVGFQSWFTEIKSFLSQISVQKTNLVQPGNSKTLLRKFNPVFRCTKTETKIKKVLAVLDELSSFPLIYNMSLPTKEEMKEKEKKKPYETLQRLENALREFISKELSKITPDWWIQRVPSDVRQHAEDRKAKSENLWPWHQEKGLPLIYYVDFSDYIKIITRKDNWKETFAPKFGDKDAVSTKLRELEPVRNNIAHSREISAHTREKLEIYAREIIAATQK